MADFPSVSDRPPPRSMPEALVRTLRHEIGDFLQKVYATVAILKDRFPPEQEQERGVLLRLWSRAEVCKRVLDTAHDFTCPVTLSPEPVDLAVVANKLLAAARERFPHLEFSLEQAGNTRLSADPKRLSQTGDLLLTNAAEAAQARVVVGLTPGPGSGEITWTFRDDGPGIAPELADKLFTPFFTTRAGHSGLGLALARKLVDLHGGRITAGNLPAGGFQARVVLPEQPPPAEGDGRPVST